MKVEGVDALRRSNRPRVPHRNNSQFILEMKKAAGVFSPDEYTEHLDCVLPSTNQFLMVELVLEPETVRVQPRKDSFDRRGGGGGIISSLLEKAMGALEEEDLHQSQPPRVF